MTNPQNEVGRRLKVSELVPQTVVVTKKDGRSYVTMWVVRVTDNFVWFAMGVTAFVARRAGPEKEEITDNTGTVIMIYEYLGKV